MAQKRIFVASTGKDVGKTTLCLGLLDHFIQKFGSCGYMKPVGQQMLNIENVSIDKDAALIRQYFHLKELQALSPIAAYPGFTKEFLDQKINIHELEKTLDEAIEKTSHYPAMVFEGTGHMGVGSIFSLSNADCAKKLQSPVILVTKGGIGSSFDELILSVNLCRSYNIPILGVVLNKVLKEKHEETTHYFKKALFKENLPYLGALPFDLLLTLFTCQDVEMLLKAKFSNATSKQPKHLKTIQIMSSSFEIENLQEDSLVLISSEKEQIIHEVCETAFLSKLPIVIALCGKKEPSLWIKEEIKRFNISFLHTQESLEKTLIDLSEYQAKINLEDQSKIQEAILLSKKHLDFNLIDSSL